MNPNEPAFVDEAEPLWLSVGAAAKAIGISTKTLRKRMATGAVKSRRVILARGGAAFEVEMESVLESSKPKFQTDFQTDREKFQNASPKSYISSGVSSVKSPGLETGLEVEMESSKTTSKPMPESSKTTSISNDRETQLRDDLARERENVAFLRGVIEQLQRDAIELRALARDALKAPRQLTAGASSTNEQSAFVDETSGELSEVVRQKNARELEQVGTAQATKMEGLIEPQNEAAGDGGREASNGAQRAPEGEETVSYSSINEWLEREMNR